MMRCNFHIFSIFEIATVRPKKLTICFSGTARVTSTPPALKIFIAFPVFSILFVDWLVRILKVENFAGNYSDTLIFGISFQKIKN